MGRIALIGIVGVAIWRGIESFPFRPRQWVGVLVLVPALVLVPLAVRWLMPEAWKGLRRHKQLFVPLGLRTVALALIGLTASLPLLSEDLFDFRVGGVILPASVYAVFLVVPHVAYAAWVTPMLLRAARGQDPDLRRTLRATLRRSPRALGLILFGHGVILLPLTVLFLMVEWFPVLPFVLVVWSLFWNLASCALVPVAFDGDRSFLQSLRTGLAASRACLGRVWPAVATQLVLTGIFTIFHVSYTERAVEMVVDGDDLTRTVSMRTHSGTHWKGTAVWFGSYQDDCEWYDHLMGTLQQWQVPLFVLVFTLLYSTLALAVKWTVIARLPRADE